MRWQRVTTTTRRNDQDNNNVFPNDPINHHGSDNKSAPKQSGFRIRMEQRGGWRSNNHTPSSSRRVQPNWLWTNALVVVVVVVTTLLGTAAVEDGGEGDGIDLGGGIITRSSNVQSFADLSQDVAQLAAYVTSGQIGEAQGLYRDGLHSESSPGVKRSLASLGDEMGKADPKTPFFLYHVYGETQRSYSATLDGTKLNYINNLILQFLDELQGKDGVTSSADAAFIVEAIAALNLYMYATHLLFTGVYECERHSLADDPSMYDIGTAKWDEFIALYIGSGQTPGQSNGYSLYAWAQKYGDLLDTSDPEADVNTRIKSLYLQAMTVVNAPNACTSSDNVETPRLLWKLAIQTAAELSKPLFQGLFHALTESQDKKLVRLYAQALVPQLAKCRPSLYKQWYETLILNFDEFNLNDESARNAILDDLPEATSCFGYSCGDLADETDLDACDYEFESYLSYAGYVPITPVRAVGMADLDVYQMKILLELQNREFAKFVYLHGANIAKYGVSDDDPIQYVSLHEIATTTERENAEPWFESFVDYNDDDFYADKVILNALETTPTTDGTDSSNNNNKWKSTDQIVAIVTTTAAYQILLLEAVSKLKIAVAECQKASDDDPPSFSLDPIDETAALMIGSMEGNLLGGSRDLEDGQLIYNINNRHAFQFGTLMEEGENAGQFSKAVSELEDLLYAARGELDALACTSLEATTNQILAYAMVGIAQGCIFLADKNSKLTTLSTSGDLAYAEGLALSLLPLVDDQDALADVTEIWERNLLWSPDKQQLVPNGVVETGKAVGEGFTMTMQLSCDNLGSIPTVNPCDGPWGDVEFNYQNGGGDDDDDNKSTATTIMGTNLSQYLAVGTMGWFLLIIIMMGL